MGVLIISRFVPANVVRDNIHLYYKAAWNGGLRRRDLLSTNYSRPQNRRPSLAGANSLTLEAGRQINTIERPRGHKIAKQ